MKRIICALTISSVLIGCTYTEETSRNNTDTNTESVSRWPSKYTGPTRFSTVSELRQWAGSSFGGGSVKELSLKNTTIYIADRCWTSGVNSSEIGIYVPDGKALVLRYSTPPMHRHYHRFRLEKDNLVIIRVDGTQKESVIERLSSKELIR